MKFVFENQVNRIATASLLFALNGCGVELSEADYQEAYSAITPAGQYTPQQADWSTFQSKPMAVSSITSHDPDGIGWIGSWPTWDGTIYDPSTMTRSEFTNAICPGGDTIRGIREVFYQHNPFADNTNPTKAEVDEWHRIAINHVRAMVGYTSPDRQVEKDHCMFARALWGQQRRFTTMWDAAYPNDTCQGSSNAHCGATFIPDPVDQVPYLPAGHPPCTAQAGAEGVSGAPKSNIPWSIKWSRAFCGYLGSEGFWGGHVGPFFHRQKFGFSFWDGDPSNNGNNATLRGKWTGTLMPSWYCDPSNSESTCEPPPVCGDNVCDSTESYESCPADCDAPLPPLTCVSSSDDFSDNQGANYTNWTEYNLSNSGSTTPLYLEQNNRLEFNRAGLGGEPAHMILYDGAYSHEDLTLQVNARAFDGLGSLRVYFYVEDTANWYALQLRRQNGYGHLYEIIRSVNGSTSSITDRNPLPGGGRSVQYGDWTLRISGDQVTVEKGSTVYGTHTIPLPASPNAAGYVGLGGSSRQPAWDNFAVSCP